MFNSATSALSSSFLKPFKTLKKRYVPLLLIYFAYGFQTVTSVAMTFWEKESLGLSAVDIASLGVWITLPWTMKMIVGQFVDHKPLFGSRRKAYIVLGALLITLGYLVLIGLMMESNLVMWMGSNFVVYLCALLLTTFGFVIQDVTADAMSTEVVKRKGRKMSVIKKDLAMVQILGRLSLMLAGIVAASLTGYLASTFAENPQKVILFALIIPIISLIGVFFIQLEEEEEHVIKTFDKTIMGLGLFYVFFVLFMAFSGGIIGQYSQEITLVVSFALLFFLVKWVLKNESPKQRKLILFVLLGIFFFRATPTIGPGFSWWGIDVLGFDREFFGILKLISSVVPFVLLWLLSSVIAQKPVRTVFLWLTVFSAVMSFPELGLYYGVHEKLGLSPYIVAMADTALDSPLVHISMIPMLAMIAFYAPSRSRATWFAVSASLMNLALTLSALITKYLNQIFVVSREVLDKSGAVIVAQDYSQLGMLMIVKIILGLVISLVAIFVFLKKEEP